MKNSEFYVKSNLSNFENHLALIQRSSPQSGNKLLK